ncbi:MAG TPA: bifunctional 3-(3-hydroxy-phenyl)propionate/3-hydroxycinnamic acid hydroxylase [Phycicoccus sp.]|jgi:3-(3-hydroxy-phenyl)propionate hydroxylase|nr:bifunctional 3-(3-hydroxy-phenyl)propionate/3-hydroxycinnamic acid hydroxylase [Phycicoccus sp.]HQK31725.1 bifunctional 3-(3-hydroxy-phenyl)propionate/3-hydroxycinnamic acid hydroxylase [Phycicoccus sp.]HRA44622.1 bifunctional 3-(3-hydroxy-phenyl)propionate/3-hydroxycinnamic acid hydroxylase [Phycicoccus sp.]
MTTTSLPDAEPKVTAAEAGTTAYDVCVVGLGPTGLTFAHLLAERGLKVLVLEREPDYYGQARAVYTDDECLRIFQTAGVADELHADMTVDLPVQWLRADRSVLLQFNNPHRRNGWPTSNFFYQPFFERTLERRLADRPGVTVRRGRAVLSVDQDADGVTVTHQVCRGAGYGRTAPQLVEGTIQQVRVPYLVAADGGRSGVRMQLGIEMTGRSFPQRWLVVDLRAREGVDAFAHLPYFDFVCDPALPTVSCPQPERRHRFEFMLHDDDVTEDFETPEKAQELMGQYVDPDSVIVDRQLVYTFNALVADRWRVGRIFLAGDAAHMTPQFIGQGMNAGVRDADNLSWKLADVLAGRADESILDSYESERRPHAKAMIDLSVFNKDMVSTGNPWAIRAREVAAQVAPRLPVARTALKEMKIKPRPRLRRGAHLGQQRRLGGLIGAQGTLLPQPPVRTHAGRPVRLDDALGTGWSLIGVRVDPHAVLGSAWDSHEPTLVALYEPGAQPQGRPAATSMASDQPRSATTLEATDDQWGRWLRRSLIRQGSVIVVRPDKYVHSVIAGPRGAR